MMSSLFWLAAFAAVLQTTLCEEFQSTLSKERIVIQTNFGDIVAALYPEVREEGGPGTLMYGFVRKADLSLLHVKLEES